MYITSKQHTKLYTQMVQGLADYAQKIIQAWQHPFAYFIANGWMVPDYYNYAA